MLFNSDSSKNDILFSLQQCIKSKKIKNIKPLIFIKDDMLYELMFINDFIFHISPTYVLSLIMM
ncbi:hypothetical protein GRAQ_02878 [Rahnella aquatilis CIP 78.65 = ATCC 33071]|nr:hypothetical protein GRAQ_02878 [Rahnella aquatilis CIP 78.65 = ATCC 33071]